MPTLCSAEFCRTKVPLVGGDCKYCTTSYCMKHRLPEDHTCAKLESVRTEAYEKNKERLMTERTVAKKVSAI